ncbi:MAG: hypothetical protein P8080_13890, partial [Gammaproteobacteria bacterium]
EVRLDENSSRVTIDTAGYPGLAAEKAMALMCESARLTVDRGFRFFRIDQQATGPGSQSSFRITFFHEVPEDVPVADLTGADALGDAELMNAAIDAQEIIQFCR